MSAKPYTDEEIAEARRADVSGLLWSHSDCRSGDRRWLATVDSLQARLAAAEAEAERARGLLVLCRPLVSTIRVGNVDPQSAHGGDQTAYAIDALLKEVADGR